MHMTFTWSTSMDEFFIDGLKVNGVAQMALVCGLTALTSVIYEAIKVHTARSKARTAREQIAAVSCAPSESANLLTVERNASNRSFSHRFCKLFCEAIVFLFHNSMGYAIMLAVMYYNGWLFVAVILGMGIGYFIFGHISMKINMENVQARTTTVICSPACPEAGGKTSVSGLSPCASISAQINEQAQPRPSTTTEPEIYLYQGTSVEPACHQQKAANAAPTAPVESEDCCCRL